MSRPPPVPAPLPESIAPDARLLFRAPNWIGDAALSLPALAALRSRWPGARITVATRRPALAVFERHPAVAERVELPARRDGDRDAVRSLRRGAHDLALLLSPSFRSAYQVWRAGVPRRIGFTGDMRGPLLTDVVGRRRGRPAAHQVREYLDLAAALGARARDPVPRLEPDGEHQAVARRVLADLPRPAAEVVAIAPFSEGGATKRWPPLHWTRLLGLLIERGLHPAIVGGPRDGRRARRLAEPVRATRGAGALSVLAGRSAVPLLPLAALARALPLLVSVDTGPMHVWAAGGGRVVALFGSSLPGLHGPLGEHHRVLHRGDLPCAGCYDRRCPTGHECMVSIPAEEVLAAVTEALADGR